MEFLQEPEVWVTIGLLILVSVLVRLGVHRGALLALDSRAIRIQAELDEALRLRQEAEALLAQIQKQREDSERLAAEMLAEAEEEAKRLAHDAQAKLEETIQRRHVLAERKIANAQSQAEAEVKAAAADLAAQIAEQVLAARLAGLKSDPLVDRAVDQLAGKLQ